MHHEHWRPISLLGHLDRSAGRRQNSAPCKEFDSGSLHLRLEQPVDCHSGSDDCEHPQDCCKSDDAQPPGKVPIPQWRVHQCTRANAKKGMRRRAVRHDVTQSNTRAAPDTATSDAPTTWRSHRIRGSLLPADSGRSWWTHFEFTSIIMATILRKLFEDFDGTRRSMSFAS